MTQRPDHRHGCGQVHKGPRAFSRYVNGVPVYQCREPQTFRGYNRNAVAVEREDRAKLIKIYRQRADQGEDLFD